MFRFVFSPFTCSSCQTTYQRKTSRHFIARFREHLGVNKKEKSIRGVSSSIREFIKDTDHSSSIDNFSTVDNADNELGLLIY